MKQPLTIKQVSDIWATVHATRKEKARKRKESAEIPTHLNVGLVEFASASYSVLVGGAVPETVEAIAAALEPWEGQIPFDVEATPIPEVTTVDGTTLTVQVDMTKWTTDRYLDLETVLIGKEHYEQPVFYLAAATSPQPYDGSAFTPEHLALVESVPAMEGWRLYLFFFLQTLQSKGTTLAFGAGRLKQGPLAGLLAFDTAAGTHIHTNG